MTLFELNYSTAPDAAPPANLTIAIPPTTSLAILVSWQAVDAVSGVRRYTVQGKTDAGAWTAWLTSSPARAARFVGQVGHTYTFRVQAVDWAGNATAWVESPARQVQAADTITKYYVFSGGAVATA